MDLRSSGEVESVVDIKQPGGQAPLLNARNQQSQIHLKLSYTAYGAASEA